MMLKSKGEGTVYFRDNFRNWILVSILFSCAILPAAPAQKHGGTVSRQPAVAIVRAALGARALRGRDYAVLLGSIPAWARIHEKTITVGVNGIAGGTPFRTHEDADAGAKTLTAALAGGAPILLPQFAATAEEGRKIAASHISVQPYANGQSYRVIVGYRLNPLSENLTIAQVRGIIGKPQAVKQRTDEGGEQDRPSEITDYIYADGAVVFETWDSGNDDVVLVTLDVQTSIEAMGGTR